MYQSIILFVIVPRATAELMRAIVYMFSLASIGSDLIANIEISVIDMNVYEIIASPMISM